MRTHPQAGYRMDAALRAPRLILTQHQRSRMAMTEHRHLPDRPTPAKKQRSLLLAARYRPMTGPAAAREEREQVSRLCFLLGLGLLCSPPFALRIGNPLARLGAHRATLLPLCLRGLRCLCCFQFSYLGFNFSGAAQQGANLRKARDFGVD